MFTAKDRQSGYEHYDPAANRHAPNRPALLGDLRRALDADEQILGLLRELGCDIVQSYHLGRPVPAADLDLRLAAAALIATS